MVLSELPKTAQEALFACLRLPRDRAALRRVDSGCRDLVDLHLNELTLAAEPGAAAFASRLPRLQRLMLTLRCAADWRSLSAVGGALRLKVPTCELNIRDCSTALLDGEVSVDEAAAALRAFPRITGFALPAVVPAIGGAEEQRWAQLRCEPLAAALAACALKALSLAQPVVDLEALGGSLEACEVACASATGVAQLRRLPKLTRLALNDAAPWHSSPLRQVGALSQLRCLSLEAAYGADLGALCSLHHLTELTLAGCGGVALPEPTKADALGAVLGCLPALAHLSISSLPLGDGGLASIAAGCRRLRSLRLANAGVSGPGLAHLASLTPDACKHGLNSADAAPGCGLGAEHYGSAGLWCDGGDSWAQRAGPRGAPAIAGYYGATPAVLARDGCCAPPPRPYAGLELLSLHASSVCDEFFGYLGELRHSLRALELNIGEGVPAGPGYSPLARMSRLTHLDLTSWHLNDACAPYIAAMPALTDLSIHWSRLGAKGLAALAAGKPATRLRAFHLTTASVLEEPSLGALAKLRRLERLTIGNAWMTDNLVVLLARVPAVEEIRLVKATGFTAKGLATLRALKRRALVECVASQEGR